MGKLGDGGFQLFISHPRLGAWATKNLKYVLFCVRRLGLHPQLAVSPSRLWDLRRQRLVLTLLSLRVLTLLGLTLLGQGILTLLGLGLLTLLGLEFLVLGVLTLLGLELQVTVASHSPPFRIAVLALSGAGSCVPCPGLCPRSGPFVGRSFCGLIAKPGDYQVSMGQHVD